MKKTAKTSSKKTPPKKAVVAAVKAEKPPVVEAVATRCPSCGSTDRDHYSNTTEHQIAGVDEHGNGYTKILWRRTRCQNCGQARIDRSYENSF